MSKVFCEKKMECINLLRSLFFLILFANFLFVFDERDSFSFMTICETISSQIFPSRCKSKKILNLMTFNFFRKKDFFLLEKFMRNFGIYVLLVVAAVLMINNMPNSSQEPNEIIYTHFLESVERDEIAKVTITSNRIDGTLKDGTEFFTITPSLPNVDTNLLPNLQNHHIEIIAKNPPEPPWWLTMITSSFPFLFVLILIFLAMRKMNDPGKFASMRQARFIDNQSNLVKVTFDDVAGADEAKQELEEVVDFLQSPQKFQAIGARIPKGVLLVGPPGTGKTLLARSVAGEAGVPFFSVSGSDFVEMFVGVGASRVRDLFEQAKKSSPAIVFIDEIDAVGRRRGVGVSGGHDEREQTLNQLLVEMDGFTANENLIIIAATNRPDILDHALLRPGRFDRQVMVDKPDLQGRLAILKVHVKGKPLADDVDLEILAKQTSGFTGADLSNLVNEAALLSARNNKKKIIMQFMQEAIERVMAGPARKSHVMSENEKKLTAYHESGHALVSLLLPNSNPVHKVTIIPRGRAGGYTLMLPKEERNYETRSELFDEIKTLLAGRVAEEIILKEISTGAQSDIQRATKIVRQMITRFGMSEELGPIAFENPNEDIFGQNTDNISQAVKMKIDQEIKQNMDAAYKACHELLGKNLDKLHAIAEALLEKETLSKEDLDEILKEVDEKRAKANANANAAQENSSQPQQILSEILEKISNPIFEKQPT